MATKKTQPPEPTLLEAWLYYTYEHSCPAGLHARNFLRRCLQRGIVSDEKVWEAATPDIKEAFYEQFNRPDLPKAAQIISLRLRGVTQAIERSNGAHVPSKVIAPLKAHQEALMKELDAKTPKVVPHATLSTVTGRARVTWIQPPKKEKK